MRVEDGVIWLRRRAAPEMRAKEGEKENIGVHSTCDAEARLALLNASGLRFFLALAVLCCLCSCAVFVARCTWLPLVVVATQQRRCC